MKAFFSILIFSMFFSVSFSEECEIISAIKNVDYILCIDGGGSKTSLHVINSQGDVQKLFYNGNYQDFITGPSGNINVIKKEGIENTFHQLFDELMINGSYLKDIANRCAIIAGFAGAGSQKNRQVIHYLFLKFGFLNENIVVFSDAMLSLKIIENRGIVLIAGTGSICFGIDNNTIKRAGGFGKLIGDEGGGYNIAMKAINRALEYENGYGERTILVEMIKAFFKCDRVNELITPIHLNQITSFDIASFSKLVFQAADLNDKIAKIIILEAAKDLGVLLKNMLIQLNKNSQYDVYLIGGIFLANKANDFILEIQKTIELNECLTYMNQKIKFINIADQPVALLAVKNILKLSK